MRQSVTGVSVLFAIGFLASLVACSSKRAPTAELMPRSEGAPATAGAPSPLETVHFATNGSVLSAEAKLLVRKNADWLKLHPTATVRVEGHCDERGSADYNLKLGERRAGAVKNLLVSMGIPPFRIASSSFGYSRPIDPGHNEAAWAANRRVESTISAQQVTYQRN